MNLFHISIDVLVVVVIWLMPTILVSMRPAFQFRSKSVCPLKSPLPPATISWDQATEEWTLMSKYVTEARKVKYRIPEGFTFDLASIPRVLWWAIGPFELSVVAPLVHDFIYRTNGVMPSDSALDTDGNPVSNVSRSDADLAFLELMKVEGVSYFRRTLAYYAVHFFGAKAWLTKP